MHEVKLGYPRGHKLVEENELLLKEVLGEFASSDASATRPVVEIPLPAGTLDAVRLMEALGAVNDPVAGCDGVEAAAYLAAAVGVEIHDEEVTPRAQDGAL